MKVCSLLKFISHVYLFCSETVGPNVIWNYLELFYNSLFIYESNFLSNNQNNKIILITNSNYFKAVYFTRTEPDYSLNAVIALISVSSKSH